MVKRCLSRSPRPSLSLHALTTPRAGYSQARLELEMPTLLVHLVSANVLPLSHVVSGWSTLLAACDGGVALHWDRAAASATASSSSAPANVTDGIGCGGRAAMLRASVSLLEALVAAHPSKGQTLRTVQPTESSGEGCSNDMKRRELSRMEKELAEADQAEDARSDHLNTLYAEVERYCQRWREVRPLRRLQLLREALTAAASCSHAPRNEGGARVHSDV
jgi:hypothetical protein